MKKTPRSLKVVVFVAFFAMITTYVLYSAGWIKIGLFNGITSLPVLKGKAESPPFELPLLVYSRMHQDTFMVIAFRHIQDDTSNVEVMAREIPQRVTPPFSPSSKSIAPLLAAPEPSKFDSLDVPSNWREESIDGIYFPKPFKMNEWMMSSKSPIVWDEPSEEELKAIQIAEAKRIKRKWIMLADRKQLLLPSSLHSSKEVNQK